MYQSKLKLSVRAIECGAVAALVQSFNPKDLPVGTSVPIRTIRPG
jgi:hypothetical protein